MTRGEQGAGRLIAGRYRLLRRLGAGGMGRVWLAYDEKLECDAALKELAVPEDITEPELGARIARARSEARHAARLRSHPHVATVHDVVEENGLPWIVMGYVPGARDLKEVVREHGPLSPAETARVGLAVLDALTAGHRLGILHRDVKPANILLTMADPESPYPTDGGQVLLADYGISLQPDSGESRVTGTSGFIGTPGFVAPERARGVPPNPASDLFSLGATLYYAVEGTGPFDRTSEYSTLAALLFEDPPPPTRAGALEPVLAGLMAKDPAQRMEADEARRTLAEIAAAPVAPREQASAFSLAETEPLPEEPSASWHPPSALSAGERTPVAAVPPRPPPQPQRPRRARALSGRSLALMAAVLLLIGGGMWAEATLFHGSGTKTPRAGPVLPYGDKVGLTRELRSGDCVSASWPAGKFKGLPKLAVVNCKNAPDGQVLKMNASASLADARANGPGICTGLLQETVRKMADAQTFALVPSDSGWDNGVRSTACLIFGKTIGLQGPVGDYRHYGDDYFVTSGSIGDCVHTTNAGGGSFNFFLVDCKKPHEDQVVGYVKAPEGTKYLSDELRDLCFKRFGSYTTPALDLEYLTESEDTWNQGFRFVACALTPRAGGPGGH
ncbi:protein kinase [Streptomyces sp. NPDC001165]|uniref:serine/threonine-protein kinase n=1 Tax=Streptomyces sp. NPDC001165 TaxID=3364546 RepID=UPI0036A6F2BF